MSGETPFDTEARVIDQARERQRHTQQHRRPPVFAILAVILAALGYILDASRTATPAWDSPQALGLAAIACIGLHLAGFPGSRSK